MRKAVAAHSRFASIIKFTLGAVFLAFDLACAFVFLAFLVVT